jgi:hypothetical protein
MAAPWFRMHARDKNVIPYLILLWRLWRGRWWRPALRRWVRGTPVMVETRSWLWREDEALAATHSHAHCPLPRLLSLSLPPPNLFKTLAIGSPPPVSPPLGSCAGDAERTWWPRPLLPDHEHGLRSDQVCVPCRQRLRRPWRTATARGGRAAAVGDGGEDCRHSA